MTKDIQPNWQLLAYGALGLAAAMTGFAVYSYVTSPCRKARKAAEAAHREAISHPVQDATTVAQASATMSYDTDRIPVPPEARGEAE